MTSGACTTGGRRRALVLAAGYGTRLAPVTDHVPKPLLPVGGQALLDRIVAALDAAGTGPIAVNTHHLGERIAEHLRARPDRDRFTLFPEPEILGTGGALDGCRSFLDPAADFLVHNGDVLCDADLAALWAEHEQGGALATLLLVDWPPVNSVEVAADGAVMRIAGQPAAGADGSRPLTFAGIGVYSRRMLGRIGPGFSSLIPPLAEAIAERPGCVRAWAPRQLEWSDLGTLPRWLDAQPDPLPPPVPGAALRLERIVGHGSERRFWRLAARDWSAVAMQSPPADEEFERQVAIGAWLERARLAPPAVLAVHAAERTLLLEDLGPTRLYELAQESPEAALPAFEAAQDWLLKLQAQTGRAGSECPPAVDRMLDLAVLRWETDYFRERFLAGHCGLPPTATADLEAEFERLAARVASQPRVLIHRDYQSQNLHWDGARIRPVDYQGMRLGPPGYDPASLVFDPYVDLGEENRSRLLDRFAQLAEDLHHRPAEQVRAQILAAALQRLMQALGAFGYLGNVRGRSGFLAHIPSGVARLREVLARAAAEKDERWLPGRLPVLEGVLDGIEG